MEEIRKSAKTVDDAIAAALAELGAAREEVDITVIDEGLSLIHISEPTRPS